MDFKGLSFKFVFNRKKQNNSKNEFHIQLRITLDREAKYFSLKDLPKIPTKYWSGKENRWVKESYPTGASINSHLITKLSSLNDFLLKGKTTGRVLTFDLIKKEFFKQGDIQTFNKFFEKYISTHKFEKPRTKMAYQTSLTTLNEFNSNIPFKNFTAALITDFIEWERSVKKKKDVTIVKHYRHISSIAKFASVEGLLHRNPLEGSKFKLKPEKANRVSLTEDELKTLMDHNFTISEAHLERDRNVFVFQCLTGLYYSDILELVDGNLVVSKGRSLISGSRTKNGEGYIVPLSGKAVEILAKFDKVEGSEFMFNGLSREQVYNRSLKVIAMKAGVKKKISNKVGRHTFTDIAISNGIPRSYVSKMLGHTKESTTQHYYDINAGHFIDGFLNNKLFS